MKDIKPNQEGLMSLAKERPDVVEKMGYDPDSFAAGGIAMLEAGGMAMDPDMAMEVFKEKQGIQGFDANRRWSPTVNFQASIHHIVDGFLFLILFVLPAKLDNYIRYCAARTIGPL